jgi:hypothetical protein
VTGAICSIGMIVWGVVRTTDEHFLLGQESHSGSVGVQIAGLVLAGAGIATLLWHWPRRGKRAIALLADSAPNQPSQPG